MTDESLTAAHLSVAMATTEAGAEDTPPSSSSTSINKLYFRGVVIMFGVVGMAANALVLYAMVAAKQHKIYVLIFNQNALDLFSSVFLIITYSVKIANVL